MFKDYEESVVHIKDFEVLFEFDEEESGIVLSFLNSEDDDDILRVFINRQELEPFVTSLQSANLYLTEVFNNEE